MHDHIQVNMCIHRSQTTRLLQNDYRNSTVKYHLFEQFGYCNCGALSPQAEWNRFDVNALFSATLSIILLRLTEIAVITTIKATIWT